ncbi:MAG: hypothetical protein JNK77_08410 [Saprospiraceae bacterium]|nr:hypothetical protein [Saprospiraceae bacterium]
MNIIHVQVSRKLDNYFTISSLYGNHDGSKCISLTTKYRLSFLVDLFNIVYLSANQIVTQNLHKNQHAHTAAVPEERYSEYLDSIPPERISVCSLFFYKDTVPPGRLRAVRYCVKSAKYKAMGTQ